MLFNNEAEGSVAERLTMASAPFGERIDSLGRYKLPLLPGEQGTKSGGDWVPRGVQSATNLAGSIVESRQLGIWERRKTQIGLALRPDLAERQAFLIRKAMSGGFDFAESRLQGEGSTPEGNAIAAELDLIHAEAKQAAGGNLAAQRGTNRHDVWEARAQTGQLFGTPEVNEQIERLEQLLEEKHLRRVPGLQERVVRNVALRAAGKFDDILQTTQDIAWGDEFLPAGTLLMADLKTKQRSYYSWLEVRIQLAVYATAEWMLDCPPYATPIYVDGPKYHVDQQWGVVLWAPSNGEPPQLKRCNITRGFAHAQLARTVCDARSEAKNVAAHGEAMW
jgi:hypothetical protein